VTEATAAVAASRRPAGRDAAWRLAHAVVVDCCAPGGIEPIVFKGAVASAHSLRAPRQAADLDVLLPPQALAEVVARLQARGWRVRAQDRDERSFPSHAVTLFRAGWPIDLDLHHRYLGVPASAVPAYDRVRRLSAHQEVDGLRVLAPRPAAHAVLVGLHCLRSPAVGRHSDELTQLLAAIDRMPVHDLIDAARALDALGPLTPLITRPEVLREVQDAERLHAVLSADPTADDEWSLVSSSARPHERRALQLRRAGWRERARLVGRWLRPSLDDLYKNRDSERRTRRRTAALYLRRIVRGVTLLPLAVLRQIVFGDPSRG
jgi:hypothetical protein